MDYSTACQVDLASLSLATRLVDKSTMPKPVEILLERIDARLSDMGETRYWLSKQITDGKQAGVITDIARKGYMPKEDRLRRMAEVLNTTVDYLSGRINNPAPTLSEVQLAELPKREYRPRNEDVGIPLVGTGDCADLEVITEDGQHIEIERSSFDPEYCVRYIERPAALQGNPDAYAIYFHGSSMEPRYFAGEVAIVDPRRPAGPGDYVLVQISDGTDSHVTSVIAKRLVRQSSREVVLSQHNPNLTFSLPRKRVVRLHRIVPPTEQLLFR